MRPFSAYTHPSKYLEKPEAAKGSTSSSSASMYSLDPPQQPSEPSKLTVSVSSGQPRETKRENHDAIRHESASKGITLHESTTGSPREATFMPSQDATVPIVHAPMPERSMSPLVNGKGSVRFCQLKRITSHLALLHLPRGHRSIMAFHIKLGKI